MRPKFNAALGQVLALCLLLAPASWGRVRYKVLHAFGAGSDGQYPAGGLVLGQRGSLYGATTGGDIGCKGDGSGGTLFRLAPFGTGWREKILYCFAGQYIDGFPDSGLVAGPGGSLFGTAAGGPGGLGDVFELMRSGGGWRFGAIYAYEGGCCLAPDRAGDIYGGMGPGVFGELSPGTSGWTYTDVYAGGPAYDGTWPVAPPSWGNGSNLYGTMLLGGNVPPKCLGSAGCGVAFQLAHNGDGTWTYNVLYRFAASKTDGYYPYAGLTVDASGTAYGLTSAGGKYGNGTFYKLTPTKDGGLWKETILYQFPNCLDGCVPAFTLVADKAGNLYGSGAGGLDCGGIGCGVIFKLSPQKDGGWIYSVVHKLNGNDGAFPYGVVLDGRGNIFGATMQGGKYNLGVAFEITP